MSDYWDRVSIEAKLITLPDIYWQLKQILAGRDYSMQDVAQLLGHDPGLTARLLRIVNSAYFGFASQIETVNHAVSILGVRQIEDLVLSTSIADALGDYECEQLDVGAFWKKSVYRAIAARNLGNACNVMDSERMFVAGLLAGIGHLIMYQSLPVLAQQARRQARERGLPLYFVEREVVGFDHVRIAAALMKNWKLPDSLVSIVEHHLEPDPEANYFLEASIVHLAALFAAAFADGLALDEWLMSAHPRARDICGLDDARCAEVDAAVREQLDGVIATLLPERPRKAS